jgi:hypothetical protein
MGKVRFIQWAFIFLMPISAMGQAKFEVQEFSGTVKFIGPGFRFALEQLVLDVNGEYVSFLFYPHYGSLIKNKIKVGEQLTLKASVNLRYQEFRKQKKNNMLPIPFSYSFHDRITELLIENEWVALSEIKSDNESVIYEVYLNKKVVSDYVINNSRVGLVFEDGLVAYHVVFSAYNPMKSVLPGTLVSFGGYITTPKPGYEYPVSDVRKECFFVPLTEVPGKINSYLYKQNYVCIGAKFKTDGGNLISVSFPSDYAKEIESFIKTNEDLIFFYHKNDFGIKNQINLPELHAIIQGTDTLYIKKFGFFGGADGKHDHTEIEFEGKITKVNTTEKGSIISVIVGSDYYVEIDALLSKQLSYQLSKGAKLKIAGKERVKKEGEIYKKEYRIITPEKIVINGKEFSLFTQ